MRRIQNSKLNPRQVEPALEPTRDYLQTIPNMPYFENASQDNLDIFPRHGDILYGKSQICQNFLHISLVTALTAYASLSESICLMEEL
jgi:hypothetical protein